MLTFCIGTSWYDGMLPYIASDSSRPLSFETGMRHASNFVRSEVQRRGNHYKIGITGHPFQRWTRTDCGYWKDIHEFTKMTIIWVSNCSRKELPDSTGRFETEIIKVFNRDVDQWCINRPPPAGGESPPRGSPSSVMWCGASDNRGVEL